jgi:diketogulonate reductase-like aldo/keto reductase
LMNGKLLGPTGLMIPEIGLGTWNYSRGVDPLRRGIELGARFIDTAEAYGNESLVGEAVHALRAHVFIATKLSPRHFRAPDVLRAADESLRRLKTDHVDLYQLHRPSYAVPIEETLGTMEQLVDAGKVRFIGVSNFSLRELKAAQATMRKHKIVSNQLRYSLVDRTIESKLLGYCQKNQVTVIAYSPLAHGLATIVSADPHGALRKIAEVTGKTAAQIALNWCIAKEGIVAIPKASSVEHVLDNCGASGWRLAPDQLHHLDEHVRCVRQGRLEQSITRLARAMRQRLRRT